MKKKIVGSLILLASVGILYSGCSGLAFWTKGKFYHSEVQDSAAAKAIGTVGVYVFSDGEGDKVPYGEWGISNWPSSEVKLGETFSPDTSNSGPSLEFANAIVKQLDERGYNAKAVTDLGHSHDIT